MSDTENMPTTFVCTEDDPWTPAKTGKGKSAVMILHPKAITDDDGQRYCPVCQFRWERP